MAAKRKKKKWKVLLGVLIVLVAVGVVFRFVVYDKAKEKVASTVIEKVFEEQAAQDTTGYAGEAQDIYNSMSEEDKDQVQKMIEDKVSPETISNVSNYVKNQDKEGLKQYVSQEFTEEEINQLKELYQKYK